MTVNADFWYAKARLRSPSKVEHMPLQVTLYIALYLLCLIVLVVSTRSTVRQWVLLALSYVLYMSWGKWFALVLAGSTFVNFLMGRWLRRRPEALPLTIGILFNVLLLGTFKYLPEMATTVPFLSSTVLVRLAMPLGISFWTFQALSYLFDQYRGEELEPTFAEFALYLAFFPVTISGPVCRLTEMLPQFRSGERSGWGNISAGVRRIAIGLLMVQVARLLGRGAFGGDGVVSGFAQSSWGGLDVWFLAIGAGLQLFFDFGGYSHIAIGAAQAHQY